MLLEERIAYVSDLAVDAILERLEVEAPDVTPPARVVRMVPGDAEVHDFTADCEGGQLSMRMASLTAYSGSARQAVFNPCSIDYWVVTMEVVLVRCVSNIDDQGNAPSADEITADGLRGLKDAGIILRALTALEDPNANDESPLDGIGVYVSRSPSGNVFGHGWQFRFKADATPCDDL